MMPKSLFNNDWLGMLATKWRLIPSLYKKSFLIIFLGLNIVYLGQSIVFVTGDEDWRWLSGRYSLTDFFPYGRYSAKVATMFFLQGYILPIFSNIIVFLGYSLTAVCLFVYWKVPKKIKVYSILGLLLVLQPYLLDWLWMNAFVVDLPWATVYVLIGYFIFDYCNKIKGFKRISLFIIGIMMIVLALGVYPSVVNSIAVFFLGRLLVDFLDWDVSINQAKQKILFHRYTIIGVCSACVCLKLIWVYMEQTGLKWADFYVSQPTSLSNIPSKFIAVVYAQFYKLWNYDFAFFPTYFTRGFAVLLALAIVALSLKILREKSFLHGIVNVLVLVLVLVSVLVFSLSSGFMAEKSLLQEVRIDFFGIAYFHVLIVVLCFMQSQFVKNIAYIFCIFLIYTCSVQDMLAQKVWRYGFEAEKLLWSRIVDRLETTEGFEYGKKYNVLALGQLPSFRPNYYPGIQRGFYALTGPHEAIWDPFSGITFISYPFTKRRCSINTTEGDQVCEEIAYKMQAEIESAQLWPHKSSVHVKDDTILLVMTEDGLNRAKALLENSNDDYD